MPTQEAVQKLIAARLAADVLGVPTLLLARTDAEAAVLVAVPRLTARLAGLTGRFPLGEAAWGETWIALSDDLAGVYRDRLTGLTLASERHDGRARLPASALLAHFPVALLERAEPAPGGPSR